MNRLADTQPVSPYALDADYYERKSGPHGNILFDGVFKGDYSLAIVNRYLARSLIRRGLDLTLYTPEADWETDRMLGDMPDVRSRCISQYPSPQGFDIHIRNTWPPRADDMIGRRINAYVCFAWEEMEIPKSIVGHFNAHLDLIMVTANFVEQSLRHSGVTIPIAVVGNGTDHVLEYQNRSVLAPPSRASRSRVLHVSSCFPRKGADLLVNAFAATFTERDDIELLIKTFDNPHNDIDEHVQKTLAAWPKAPRITVLKQSMSNSELGELIKTSDLLVAPSRGEGFGLPLAEAILLDVPVVTTDYSGQTDFCTAETAWLVECRMVPSQAHVSTKGAMWAEADLASLGRQMRRAVSDRAASRAKLDRGKALLRAHFKWSDVARRVCQALEQNRALRLTEITQPTSLPLRIELVSTWNQVCGIASYSEHLFATEALKPTLGRVLARELRGDVIASEESVKVSRPWGYEAAGVRCLEAVLGSGEADIVWFQHHPAFFSEDDMNGIASVLRRSAYRKKVITLHNVQETIENKSAAWLDAFDAVIVHTQRDAALLLDHNVAVEVIPHGILAHRAVLRPPSESFMLGTFGFLYPHKNVPLLVEALSLARKVEPRLRLRLLTCVRNDPISFKERVRVEALVESLGLEDVVEMDFGYLADEEIVRRLSGCDLLCFPYGESSESATGAARIALAADRPLLCSQSSVLGDILPLALVLSRVDVRVLAEAIIVMSASTRISTLRDVERKTFIERHSYPVIAQRHVKLFESLLRKCR